MYTFFELDVFTFKQPAQTAKQYDPIVAVHNLVRQMKHWNIVHKN